VSHNHPSSNLAPSQQDLDLTHKLKDGGKLLEIQLLDHLIIVPDGRYMSLSDEAYL
jgi:DNA repair protein RadC